MTFRPIPTADGALLRAVVNPDGTTVSAVHGVQNVAGSQVNPATEDTLASILTAIAGNSEYETVAASATDQVLGPTGAAGDYLAALLVVPATTSPGAITIKDGGGSAITVFTGGASSVSNLVPFAIPLGLKSVAGAWKVTTGTSVSVLASGNFT